MNLWLVLRPHPTPPPPSPSLLLPGLVVTHAASYVFPAGTAYVKRAPRCAFQCKRKNPFAWKGQTVYVCVCMCEGVWNDGLLWGGHPWPSATQGVPVCVYLYNMWMCEVDNTLSWSPVPFLSCASACVFECVYCMREWWVLWGGHRGLPHVPWLMSSAGKQKAKCHEVKGRGDKKRCAAAVKKRCLPSAETDTWVKDINSAGDVNEKWHCEALHHLAY